MGFADPVPVVFSDAEYRRASGRAGSAMHPKYFLNRDANETPVRRVLLLFVSDIFFGKDWELGKFFSCNNSRVEVKYCTIELLSPVFEISSKPAAVIFLREWSLIN